MQQKIRTYSTEGLSEIQIKFLDYLDSLWFAKKDDFKKVEMLSLYAKKNKITGEEMVQILSACDYWMCIYRPVDVNSFRNPKTIGDIILCDGIKGESKGLPVSVNGDYCRFATKRFVFRNPGLYEKCGMICGIGELGMYLEISGDKLWLSYSDIIGSRLVAKIKPLRYKVVVIGKDGKRFIVSGCKSLTLEDAKEAAKNYGGKRELKIELSRPLFDCR